MARTRVTLDDVAARAGVHPATVSRTLSRPQLVSADTRARVLHAVDELGYTPNLAARGLVTGRTSTLAIVVPDVVNPYFAMMVRAAQSKARLAGYEMLLGDTGQDPTEEVDLVRRLARHVDGLVVCVPQRLHRRARDVVAGTPVVFVNRRVVGQPAVLVDQRRIVDEAIGHLASLGHRRVAVVAGPDDYWSAGERARRVTELATDVALETIGPFDPTFAGGRAVADAIPTSATAVATFNDVQALGLLTRLRDRGRRVPDDLSVVGSDDVPMAAMSSPPLTTVAAPFREVGEAAVTLLLRLLDGDPELDAQEPPELHLAGRIVVRESTGPLRR